MTEGQAPPDSPYRPPRSEEGTDGRRYYKLAVAGFVLAFIPCLNVIGGALSVVALVRVSGRPRELKGQGLAVGGVVVAAMWLVVLVLAAIAIPSYLRFSHRAKQAEAKGNLKSIYLAAEVRRLENGELASDFESIGWTPQPGTRYTYYYGNDRIAPDRGKLEALPRDVEAWVRPETGEFQAVAVGNIDSDPALDVWVITDQNDLNNLSDDTTE